MWRGVASESHCFWWLVPLWCAQRSHFHECLCLFSQPDSDRRVGTSGNRNWTVRMQRKWPAFLASGQGRHGPWNQWPKQCIFASVFARGFAIIRRSPSAPALCVWESAHERIFYARTAHDPTRAQSTCVFQGYSGGTSPESLFFACVKCASGKIPPGHSWESSLAMCECNESWRAFPASGQCKHAPGISGPDGVSFCVRFREAGSRHLQRT